MLALTVISQLLHPGLPVIRGMSSSVPNMQNSLNLSGAIEIGLLAAAMSQLSDYYNIPCSMSSGTDSKLPDAQASIERLFTSLPAIFSMTDLINITTIDTKMCFSLEQLVIDNEIMEMIGRFLRGIEVTTDTLALADIIAVGPGGDYLTLMAEHTCKYFRKELQQSKIFDRSSLDSWEKAGAKDLQERARIEALRLQKEHQPNDLDKNIKETLENVIKKYSVINAPFLKSLRIS
jgi:trimethylamine--corrinoid protein Co-methyltransferase